MSDTDSNTDSSQNNSLLSNFTNKIKYNLHKAAYDPNANQFAQQQQAQAQAQTQAQTQQTDTNSTDNQQPPPQDPNSFNVKRMATKVGNQFVNTMKMIMPPFISLMLAMIVTNEMIVYSVPIRIIFFIFIFIVTFKVSIAAIVLGIFYLLKGLYSYYYNNMTDRPKKNIMPTIFALLPITTYKPTSSLVSFFMYPFTYPKTELAAIKLPELMKDYWVELQESFKDFDKVKGLPIFVDDLKRIQTDLSKLHDSTGLLFNLKLNTTLPTGTNVAEKQVLENKASSLGKGATGTSANGLGTVTSANGLGTGTNANGLGTGTNESGTNGSGNEENGSKNVTAKGATGSNAYGTNGSGNGENGSKNGTNILTKSTLLGTASATEYDKKAVAISAAIKAHKEKIEKAE